MYYKKKILEVTHTLIYLICRQFWNSGLIFFSVFFEFKFVSKINPKKCNYSTRSMLILLMLSGKGYLTLLFI